MGRIHMGSGSAETQTRPIKVAGTRPLWASLSASLVADAKNLRPFVAADGKSPRGRCGTSRCEGPPRASTYRGWSRPVRQRSASDWIGSVSKSTTCISASSDSSNDGSVSVTESASAAKRLR